MGGAARPEKRVIGFDRFRDRFGRLAQRRGVRLAAAPNADFLVWCEILPGFAVAPGDDERIEIMLRLNEAESHIFALARTIRGFSAGVHPKSRWHFDDQIPFLGWNSAKSEDAPSRWQLGVPALGRQEKSIGGETQGFGLGGARRNLMGCRDGIGKLERVGFADLPGLRQTEPRIAGIFPWQAADRRVSVPGRFDGLRP